ncbi:MAG: hypothetical protein PHH37_15880 [Paludibacter sp.]|nr:hypothetical protein [Paludibacter sp.]
MDFRILDLRKGEISYEYILKDFQTNFYGSAHGGVLASVCDVAMGVSCITLGK